jgi:hypothetical protein
MNDRLGGDLLWTDKNWASSDMSSDGKTMEAERFPKLWVIGAHIIFIAALSYWRVPFPQRDGIQGAPTDGILIIIKKMKNYRNVYS